MWDRLSLRHKGLLVIAMPLLAVALVAVPVWLSLRSASRAERQVSSNLQAFGQTSRVLRLVVDEETGVRGYLLTADRSYLDPATAAAADLPAAIDRLETTLTSQPDEVAIVERVRDLAAERADVFAPLLAGAPIDDAPVAEAVASGKRITDQIRDELQAMMDRRTLTLSDARAEATSSRNLAIGVLVGSLVFGLGAGVAASLIFTRGVAARVAEVAANAKRLSHGEALSPAATHGRDEVGELARGLEVAARRLQQREQELREARNAADKANRSKSDFVSRMSHELRTPLNAVLGFAQLLEMDELDADQADSVAHIRRAGAHLLELINEVLDMARIESGRMNLSPEPVQVAEVVADTVGLIRPLADAREITVHAVSIDADTFVLADRQRLRQVLLNLLSNAVKYNRDAGSISVACERDGDHLRIAVTDTGPGIPEELQGLLFEPFERLGADERGIEGSGMGLALSQRLVHLMDGVLGVRSVVGQGSTLWVELPAADPPAPDTGSHPLLATAEQSDGDLTVLYVEDNLSNLKLVERILAHRKGVNLIPAMQGRLGLEFARQLHPDLILLDLHLPDTTGAEVLNQLAADPTTAATPVVVLSADASPGTQRRLLAQGALAFLTKPLDANELLDVVDRATGTARL